MREDGLSKNTDANTDSHDVGTHYFGDGCTPPHECPCDHTPRLGAQMCGTCGFVYPVGMCPHCGEDVLLNGSLTATHDWPKPTRQVCPGSGQVPRCAESDARPLWNGEPNRRFAG